MTLQFDLSKDIADTKIAHKNILASKLVHWIQKILYIVLVFRSVYVQELGTKRIGR